MKFTKQQWQWIFYDWANSGYGILVVTAVLPVYFKAVAGESGINAANSTALWGYANSFGTLVISLMAPLLGALADYPNSKRRWLNFFTWIGIIMTFALAVIPPKQWGLLLLIYVFSIIGYSGGNLFYDGFLTDVADDQQMDAVSTTGYGMGYLGGVIVFIIFLVAQVSGGFNCLLSSYGIAKFSFILAAIWWVIFAWPLLRYGHQNHNVQAVTDPVMDSFHRLGRTLHHIKRYRKISWFLVAYFFYIDGVDTIFTMATAIGKDLGIETTMLMLVLLMVQLIAFPFSILYGFLAQKTSNRLAILLGIIVYLFICLDALHLKSLADFWVLAVLVGTSQGGLQALSRSYFGQLIPKNSSSEFFGFYNILGKFSAILGPVIVGFVTQLTGKSTVGAASLSILFLIGLVIFLLLPRLTRESGN
ncbi:MFS transporter [Limosilactobacillus fastidiosus]|uniref:MFS transporter n=1 Tax=Limosilactobacillus fastidiosus TaxID=2759855 RepID=A0A7W3TY83_9LACO|nr:MFS transporter [Limosilactobacillus fastidiosus]MBB1062566.1 MFS transporter [Limosilactobacillus fastidiosus]MBB1085481.1 MFS transporter [Limosilactobacillus fastidiosus]MCD7083641.1 MFS transporter [Limosilactobacillus fastidiosus]MCD7085935.1 MFS transporter [Limosilactobacillus fastidiosus]MCD7114421.1 MFS transporter [Limosilactobacillus fastidiosus]